MALAVQNLNVDEIESGFKLVDAQLVFDNAYPSGGYSGIANLLGFQKLRTVIVNNKGGYDVEYVRATDKLKISYGTGSSFSSTHLEVPANLAGLNGLTVDVFAIGQ